MTSGRVKRQVAVRPIRLRQRNPRSLHSGSHGAGIIQAERLALIVDERVEMSEKVLAHNADRPGAVRPGCQSLALHKFPNIG